MHRYCLVSAAAAFLALSSAPAWANPPLPPGGWWKEARPGCEAYVTSANDTATMFTINGQRYGFRRGPNCNYAQATGNSGSIWVNYSRTLSR